MSYPSNKLSRRTRSYLVKKIIEKGYGNPFNQAAEAFLFMPLNKMQAGWLIPMKPLPDGTQPVTFTHE